MTQPILAELCEVSVIQNGVTILHPVSLKIQRGEQWAIAGHSGSGKTMLANALAGKIHYHGTISYHLSGSEQHHARVLMIEQQHRFKNRSNTSDFYYQQRYNSADAEDTITVAEYIEEAGHDTDGSHWMDTLHITPLLQKPLIQLSNGENKRLQIVQALFRDPAILILDNPFTGLDVDGRKTLHHVLNEIVQAGIHIILITAHEDMPACLTHIAILENGKLVKTGKVSEIKWQHQNTSAFNTELIKQLPAPEENSFNFAVKMVNVSVRYGEKIVLQNINWEVKKGERWCISGPNGSGKSTLLSLISADNPQAYANEIYLFDRRRGSGESIWDIKKRIGFVSPELHLFFDRGTSVFDVIASGLFDTIGLFRQLGNSQVQQVNRWLDILRLQSLKDRPLFRLSLGQQRLVLLARALVKNPPLLILDEPCQGLDETQTKSFNDLIDLLCLHFDTTLLYVSHYDNALPSTITHRLSL
jgi:ABC-type molybdenum transport system, ATPase component/photorepair protein PhrA